MFIYFVLLLFNYIYYIIFLVSLVEHVTSRSFIPIIEKQKNVTRSPWRIHRSERAERDGGDREELNGTANDNFTAV